MINATSSAGLYSQLQLYEKKLGDASCCSSAKTQSGQQNIQKLAQEVSTLKTEIKQVEHSSKTTPDPEQRVGTNIDFYA